MCGCGWIVLARPDVSRIPFEGNKIIKKDNLVLDFVMC